MKRCIVLVFLFLSAVGSIDAQFASPKKGGVLGFGFNFTDFETPAEIKATSLRDVFKNKNFSSFSRLNIGFSLMYWKGLTNHLDFSARYNGVFSDYSKSAISSATTFSNELETSLHARLLSDDHTFNPFVSAGLGGGTYESKVAGYAPLGIGLQVNLASTTYIFLQANYRVSLDKARLDNNLFYAFGITESISSPTTPKVAPPPPPIPVVEIKDQDKDGIVDSVDACPDVAGTARFNGCPDTDSDGIIDKEDKCPTVEGLLKYDGCPIPDTDNDGMNDEADKCPSIPGVAKYEGCPVPDTDLDGINDEEDKCPNVPGVKENSGCPIVKEEVVKKVAASASNIFFATGSAKLLTKSFKGLKNVATILKEDADLKLDIDGHTDNTGKPEKNQVLSEQRAKAVADYLVKKLGVDAARITAAGFGDTKPVAPNKTAKGKAANRRVVLTPKYY